MPSLVWASSFLLLAIIGSTVGCFDLIGMPVAVELKTGLFALVALLLGSGVLLLAVSPPAKPDDRVETLLDFHHE